MGTTALYQKERRDKHPKYHTIYMRKYFIKYPWAKTLNFIISRCSQKNNHYYKKGIKNFLTLDDLKLLWYRNKAYSLKQPSIHRKNRNKNYTLENCKFIELVNNLSEGGRITCRQLNRLPNGQLCKGGQAEKRPKYRGKSNFYNFKDGTTDFSKMGYAR